MIELIPIDKLREYQFDEVVAVMRGGMTAAHYIAKELQLKCGAYFPASKEFDHDRLILANPVAPHVTEEAWQIVNADGSMLHNAKWPVCDEKMLLDDEIEIPVQIKQTATPAIA